MNFIKKHKILTVILLLLSFYLYLNFTKFNNYERNYDTKGKNYINELYKSDNRVYETVLNDKQKKMYSQIIKEAKAHSTKTIIDLEKFDCADHRECGDLIDIATSAIWVDHPELMNFAGYRWSYRNGELILRIDYAYTFPIQDYIGILRIENIVSKIKEATKNMSDKEKIIYVYNWMGRNNYYDKTFMFDSKNQSIYNVFVRGNAVCAGFAKASHIIFSQIGIESYIVEGISTGPHMWNIVKYKDKFYFFDSTVAVSINEGYTDYHYEGLKQSFLNSYTISYPNWYPKVESENMFKID